MRRIKTAPASSPNQYNQHEYSCTKLSGQLKGIFRAQYYSGPVHYYDTASAQYRDIDVSLTLNPQTDCYENTQGAAGVQFVSHTSKLETFTLYRDRHIVRWRFAGRKGYNGIYAPARNQRTAEVLNPEINQTQQSEIWYPGVLQDVDLQYIVQGGGIKENIIVSSPAAAGQFDFDLCTENLTIEPSPDGKTLHFYDAGPPHAEVFCIPAPIMRDASGAQSADVYYELSACRYGQRLSVIPNRDWLTAPARVYPVAIDPTILIHII